MAAPDRSQQPSWNHIDTGHSTPFETASKETVARYLQKLDLTPVILHEQANKGRTIHQKFRDHSKVGFAVVLFTPDDVGGPRDESLPPQSRPRQNVVYELGFFSAMLGDSRVCVLHSEGVEILSDRSGVLYIPLDDTGSWRVQLAKEIKSIGIDVDMNKAI